jgi:hypothetical protein
MYKFGLRYERLLILSGPLSLMAIVVFFIALASATPENPELFSCYSTANSVFETNRSKIESEWAKQPATKLKLEHEHWENYYNYSNVVLLIASGSNCYGRIAQISQKPPLSPDELIKSIRAELKRISERPLKLYDIQVPEKATFNVLGTTIGLPIVFFTQLLQVTLAPLLLLWLASLYNTRFRELACIVRARNHTEVFPHILNFYATGPIPTLNRKSYSKFILIYFILSIYLLTRIGLLCLLTCIPVFAFIASVHYLHPSQYEIFSYFVCVVVVIFFTANLLLEAMPLYAFKIFSPIVNPKIN